MYYLLNPLLCDIFAVVVVCTKVPAVMGLKVDVSTGRISPLFAYICDLQSVSLEIIEKL